MGNIDMRFKYTNAADSAKPGYLRRKFANERKRLAEEAEKQKAETEATTIEQELKVRILHK